MAIKWAICKRERIEIDGVINEIKTSRTTTESGYGWCPIRSRYQNWDTDDLYNKDDAEREITRLRGYGVDAYAQPVKVW